MRGHDATHVRDYGMQKTKDEEIFERAAREDRAVMAADTDFGTILAIRQASKPSVILFRLTLPRKPDAQVSLFLVNLPHVGPLIERGSIIVFEDGRIRARSLPIVNRA